MGAIHGFFYKKLFYCLKAIEEHILLSIFYRLGKSVFSMFKTISILLLQNYKTLREIAKHFRKILTLIASQL